MKKSLLAVISLMLILAMTLVGCTSKPATPATPPATTGSETPKPTAGGTLRMGDAWSVVTLDPAMYNDEGSWHAINQIYDALVDRGPQNEIIPRLATKWETPDPNTWIFTLRQGVKWHDDNEVFAKGQAPEVTAEDVKYSIERIQDPATKSGRVTLVNSITKVEVMDKYKVKLTTKEPDAFLLGNLVSVYVLNKKVVDTLGAKKMAVMGIGSGPFKFKELKPDDHITLVKNENYWIRPNLDQLIYKPIPDPNACLVALEAGDVDTVAQVPQLEYDRLKKNTKLDVARQPNAAYRYLAFNNKKAPFDNAEFRHAIAMGIDMDAIVKAIFPSTDMAVRAVGPIPPQVLGYDTELKKYWPYDVAKGKEALGKLGYKDANNDGILEKDGKALEFTLITPQDANRSKLGVMIGQQLKDVGVKVNVQALEWGTLLSRSNTGDFDAFLLGGYSGDNGMLFLFHSRNQGPNGNSALYTNAEVDKLLDKGVTLLDEKVRVPVWKQAQELIVKDAPHIPAYHEYFFYGKSKKVQEYYGDHRFVTEKVNTWIQK